MITDHLIYTVLTRHGAAAYSGGTSNAFIVPLKVEANSYEEAARKRFDMLSSREQEGCVALLVSTKYGSAQRLFEVEKVTTPFYRIKPAA